jgi:Fic family protein
MSKEGERASQPLGVVIPTDPEQVALAEARNALRQVDEIRKLIQAWLAEVSRSKPFRLRISQLLRLNRVAIQDLDSLAGVFRPGKICITDSRHNPPPPEMVPSYAEEMCDYVNEHFESKTALHLSAYLLWRTNWIHPFNDGNGRTARAISYAVLCSRLGYELPGTPAIPEQIAENKQPYYKALEAADEAYKQKELDVRQLEGLLEDALAKQLVAVHERATGKKIDPV